MAFPGTFNISYYRGDTYEFRVYPKTASGATFDLTTFSDSESDHVKFTIASARGSGSLSLTTFAATLSTSTSNVVLTSGTTTDLKVGQLLSKVSGIGEFEDNVRIVSIVDSTTFTVSANHQTAGDIVFKIASVYSGIASISSDKTYITCVIDPTTGSYLQPNSSYVYDIEIKNAASPYDYIYTVLTGNITVTDHITGAF